MRFSHNAHTNTQLIRLYTTKYPYQICHEIVAHLSFQFFFFLRTFKKIIRKATKFVKNYIITAELFFTSCNLIYFCINFLDDAIE